MKITEVQLLMIDSLVGNDYSECLFEKLDKSIIKKLVVSRNRIVKEELSKDVLYWMPAKDESQNNIQKLLTLISYFFKVYKKVLRDKRLVVHYQFFRHHMEALFFWLLSKSGAKLVFTAHNVLPHENKKYHYYLKKIVYKEANKIIVHSNYIKNRLLENFEVDHNKIHVVNHGNFNRYISKHPMSKTECRKILGLSSEDKVLLFFGFIRSYKGLDDLLYAFEIAVKLESKLKLVIVGEPFTKEIEVYYSELITNLSLKDKVLYNFNYVRSENIQIYFNACDLVVLPYKKIDHSGILHLAFSFSKPVLATDVGDFSEIIKDKYGFLTPPNDVEELKNSIILATKDMQKLSSIGSNAYDYNNTYFDWKTIALETEKVYKSLF